jgi:hypothetical protein
MTWFVKLKAYPLLLLTTAALSLPVGYLPSAALVHTWPDLTVAALLLFWVPLLPFCYLLFFRCQEVLGSPRALRAVSIAAGGGLVYAPMACIVALRLVQVRPTMAVFLCLCLIVPLACIGLCARNMRARFQALRRVVHIE